jgi:hypothetical protein
VTIAQRAQAAFASTQLPVEAGDGHGRDGPQSVDVEAVWRGGRIGQEKVVSHLVPAGDPVGEATGVAFVLGVGVGCSMAK